MKKRFETKETKPFGKLSMLAVRSFDNTGRIPFEGAENYREKSPRPYIEIEGVEGMWLSATQAREVAEALIAHADRIKRYKESERAKRKP